MIAAGHSSIGIIVAVVVERLTPSWPLWLQVFTVFTIALASHYIVDFIPHGHYHRDLSRPQWWEKIAVGMDLVGFALLALLISFARTGLGSQTILIVSGIAGGQFTDVWDWVIVARGWVPLRGWVAQHRRLHELLHWHNVRDERGQEKARPIGWWDAWQLMAIFMALYLLASL